MTKHKNKLRSSGFTLIELLLVLVILATLAAIVVPKFARRTEQANVTAAKTQIVSFETALETFEIDLGRYPTNIEGLKALVEKPSGLDKWREPYLRRSQIPKDPWGNEYVYKQPGQYNEYSYDLYSKGADGQQGGEDDIGNWENEDGTTR
jgi:general secretion pathway protein G